MNERSLMAVACAAGLLLGACSVKEPPKTAEVVEDALPPTTEVSADWRLDDKEEGRGRLDSE